MAFTQGGIFFFFFSGDLVNSSNKDSIEIGSFLTEVPLSLVAEAVADDFPLFSEDSEESLLTATATALLDGVLKVFFEGLETLFCVWLG